MTPAGLRRARGSGLQRPSGGELQPRAPGGGELGAPGTLGCRQAEGAAPRRDPGAHRVMMMMMMMMTRARGEITGSHKYGHVGKSQWVLSVINLIISSCARLTATAACGGLVQRWMCTRGISLTSGAGRLHSPSTFYLLQLSSHVDGHSAE
jgi:hypothetical protein